MCPDCAPLAAGWELCGRDMTHEHQLELRLQASGSGSAVWVWWWWWQGGESSPAQYHLYHRAVAGITQHHTTHWVCKHHSLSQYTKFGVYNILGHKDVLPRIFPLAIPSVFVICLSPKEN